MATDLPEDTQLKRRARRRLIGAIALVLLAVIILPMIFDAEKKAPEQDVLIQIPNQGDYVAKAPPGATPAAPQSAADAAKAAADTPAKAPAPVMPKDTPKADTPPKDATRAEPAPKAEVKPDAKAESKAAAKAEAKAPAKAEPKAEAKAPAKAPSKIDEQWAREQEDAKRAQALLNGGDSAPKSDKAEKLASASGSYVVQIAAFASEEKAQEARDKLGAAGVKAYAEKVSTQAGERTRVRAGPYASKDAAEAVRDKVGGLGFSGATVVRR